jgi:Flp pilus assembly protein TadB
MSDRERRVLESIEQELRRSDPQFVRRFARLGRRRMTGPAMLLVVGLVVIVLGSAIVSVPVAVLGMGIAGAALLAAYHRPLGFGFRGRT